VCLLVCLLLTTRGNRLSVEKGKRNFTDIVIEKSVELYGFTPDEMSDENQNWMLENGYLNIRLQKRRSGIRGRRPKEERF
jgi:hypothetical protein